MRQVSQEIFPPISRPIEILKSYCWLFVEQTNRVIELVKNINKMDIATLKLVDFDFTISWLPSDT